MKPTVTMSWRSLGVVAMVAFGSLVAIMPTRLAGASAEKRLADVASAMPAEGFAVSATTLADWLASGKPGARAADRPARKGVLTYFVRLPA